MCNFTMGRNDKILIIPIINGCIFFFIAPKPDVKLVSTPVCVESNSNLSLTCTATLPLPHELEFPKVFKWTMNDSDITSDDSSPTNPKGVVSVSTLNLKMTSSGVFVFKCEVSISVPGDPVVTSSSSLTITPQGI